MEAGESGRIKAAADVPLQSAEGGTLDSIVFKI
jgi:hypothetical protein